MKWSEFDQCDVNLTKNYYLTQTSWFLQNSIIKIYFVKHADKK